MLRWLARGLLGIAALVVALVGAVLAALLIDDNLVRPRYYAARPLVTEMRAADDRNGPSAKRRDVLLSKVPLGTAKLAATGPLIAEGFGCNQVRSPQDDIIVCGLREDPGFIILMETAWHVEMHFADDRLSSLTVMTHK